MSKNLTSRSEDYSKWYNELVVKADLAESSGVRGCMVIKPYGYAIWEKMQAELTGIYRELFTQEEINSLIDFYQSPAGQAMVKKMPLIQNKTVQIYQKILARAMPRIQKVMEETLKENHADHHHGNQTGETRNHPSP